MPLNALGFTNRSLRAHVSRLLGVAYTVNQMSYDLARLRLNKLIERRLRSNTYDWPPTANELPSSTPKSTIESGLTAWSQLPGFRAVRPG